MKPCYQRAIKDHIIRGVLSSFLWSNKAMELQLQKVIDKLKEEAEAVPGGKLWRMKKEVKDLLQGVTQTEMLEVQWVPQLF